MTTSQPDDCVPIKDCTKTHNTLEHRLDKIDINIHEIEKTLTTLAIQDEKIINIFEDQRRMFSKLDELSKRLWSVEIEMAKVSKNTNLANHITNMPIPNQNASTWQTLVLGAIAGSVISGLMVHWLL